MTNRRAEKKTDTPAVMLPPQNVEAEESLLSAVLIDNTLLLEIIEMVSPEDFYRSAHQRIFRAMIDLFEKNEPIDLITLSNNLKSKSLLEEIGGAAYLANLIDAVPMAVNVHHYAKIVSEKAVLRRLIEKAGQISRRCFEDMEDLDEIVDFAQKSIFEIAENKIRKAFHPISELINANIDKLEEKQGNNSMVTGVPSGFTDLDRLTSGFQNSDLVIIAARPSMGKTALALNIARNAAVESNTPVAVFSLEMAKEQLSLRMLCSEARVDSSRLRSGFWTDEDWQNVLYAAGRLSNFPIYIDDSPVISATEIRAKARRMKMEKNIGLVIIDYLQLMRSHRTQERRDLEISDISRSLKSLAKELDIPVLALSQLNRMLEQRNDKRPRLSDLRESGALEQDADVVAFIYRDEVYNTEENNPHKGTAEVILAKQRNGPTGTAILSFLNAYTRFENYTTAEILS
jgi:replicative DNA helicase